MQKEHIARFDAERLCTSSLQTVYKTINDSPALRVLQVSSLG